MATIYLSSTYEDLKDYRRAVFEALRKIGHDVIAMEDYVATDQRPVQKCLDDVANVDIIVGLFGFRYGYVPPPEHNNPEGLSITELELREAERLGKPCLPFVVSDETPWPPKFIDGFKDQPINRLRNYLLTEKTASFFSSSDGLVKQVIEAITGHLDRGKDLRLVEHATEEARRWQKRGDRTEELWPADRIEEVLNTLYRFGKTPAPVLERFLKPQKLLVSQLENDVLSHGDRMLIGNKLVEFGDSRLGVGLNDEGLPDLVWVEIPGGEVTLEDMDHVFEVKPFRLAKYPVTNRQFQAFIDDGGYECAQWWNGIEKMAPRPPFWGESNCPREKVSWHEAVAFCRWLSDRRGKVMRLPTEWEWQQAATGGDPTYEYPWGREWDQTRCNSDDSGLRCTSSVGLYPHGATPQGAMDMAGNVWEWCLNTYHHPAKPESVLLDTSDSFRVLRGGAWSDIPGGVRALDRGWHSPDAQTNFIGFRLAQHTP